MGQRFSPPLCSSLISASFKISRDIFFQFLSFEARVPHLQIAHGSVEFSELCSFQQRRMAWMSIEPLVSKLDMLSKYFILLAIMVATMIYSPPDFATENPKSSSSSS
nr:DNA helicase [Ipomoea batatas]